MLVFCPVQQPVRNVVKKLTVLPLQANQQMSLFQGQRKVMRA